MSQWEAAIAAKDRTTVANEIHELRNIVQEAVSRDDSLFAVVSPYVKAFVAFAESGTEPLTEELVKRLPAVAEAVGEIDAAHPVLEGIAFLQERSSLTSGISLAAQRALDEMSCSLKWHLADVQSVGKAVTGMQALVDSATPDAPVDGKRLAVEYYRHVGRYHPPSADRESRPLGRMDLLIAQFTHDWLL